MRQNIRGRNNLNCGYVFVAMVRGYAGQRSNVIKGTLTHLTINIEGKHLFFANAYTTIYKTTNLAENQLFRFQFVKQYDITTRWTAIWSTGAIGASALMEDKPNHSGSCKL